ncbi:MAG TPA: hypothetical protein PK954_19785 [Anaerolineales bacterium]|nr:hypothetical protein [Anaerolineales bacterium]HRF46202.1 hypothetical protein [Anaerolineales bacterium]
MPIEELPAEGLSRPTAYEIRIQGHLGHELAGWFEGLSVTAEEDGTTLLGGLIADQAALHGLLRKIRDVGLPLISIVLVQPSEPHPVRSSKGKA